MVAAKPPVEPENDDDKPVTMGTLKKMFDELAKDTGPPKAPEAPAATSSRAEPAPTGSLTDQIELVLRRREEARRLERAGATAPAPAESPKSWREKLFG